MLILLLFPVLRRVSLLDGMLIWPLLILWVLVLLLMLLVGVIGTEVLVRVGISLLAVVMLLLLLRLAMSLIGGLLLTFQFLLAFVLVPGWLTLIALLFVSLFGLLVGWTLLIGPPRRPLVLSRMSGMFIGMNLGWFLRVVLDLRGAVSRSSVDDFWSICSRNAEAGLFRSYSKAGGPTEAGCSAFLGRGLLRIRNRRLGGRAAGGKISSRLYRVSHGDEVDVHCAQYFVNFSLSPVLLFRRRLKSVADVLKGIRSEGFTQSRWDALSRYWSAVCRHGPCGPISSLHPWDNWIPPVEPHLIDAEFREAWMSFFCRSGHPVVTPDQFSGLCWSSFSSGGLSGSS